MFLSRLLAQVAIFFVLILRANADSETHTITFVNQCGPDTSPVLMYDNANILEGDSYTSNGPFSGIAYLNDTNEPCGWNGENCILVEMTLINPECAGCGSSTDLSLISPHAYNDLASFSYYNGCDGQGKMCTSANCEGDAFFFSTDYVAQVACETNNVDLLIAFCANASDIVLSGGSTTASGSSSPASSLPTYSLPTSSIPTSSVPTSSSVPSLGSSTPGSVPPVTEPTSAPSSTPTETGCDESEPPTPSSTPSSTPTETGCDETEPPSSTPTPTDVPSGPATSAPTSTPPTTIPSESPTSAPTSTSPTTIPSESPTSAPTSTPSSTPTIPTNSAPVPTSGSASPTSQRCRPRTTSLAPSNSAPTTTPSLPPTSTPSTTPATSMPPAQRRHHRRTNHILL